MNQERWGRVEDLFHAALERAPEARQAFLDDACRENAELRQQVELLLKNGEGQRVRAPLQHGLSLRYAQS